VGEAWKVALKSHKINAKADYDLGTDRIDGEIDLAGSRIKISGAPKQTITASLHTASVKQFLGSLTNIYKVEIPPLDGDLALTLKIDKLAKASLELKSKQFVPDDSARIKSPIKNIDLVLEGDLKNETLIVRKYNLETA
jgi:hypothetical protein